MHHTHKLKLRTFYFRLLTGLIFSFCTHASFASAELLDRVIAVVEDDIIMESELAERTAFIKKEFARRGAALPPEEILKQQLLERLILESIQKQLAERYGLRVDDNTLNQTLVRIASQNNMTLTQFREKLLQSGESFNYVREQVRKELLFSQVRQQTVGRRVKISAQDIKTFLASEQAKLELGEEYRLSHILLQLPQKAKQTDIAAVRKKAESLSKALQNGADFAQLAAQNSRGQKALEGGDLGWRKAVQLPTLFSDIVVKMNKGDVSKPIRSASGFHIIKLTDQRGSKVIMVKQTQVRHILIKPSEIRSESESKDLAIKVRQSIIDGKSFSEAARLYSDDPSSAHNGGKMDWVSPGTLVPEFEKTMNAIDIGQLSQPFLSKYGWHFLEVTARRNENQGPAYRENQARAALQKRRYDAELQRWLREIRQEAYVDIKKRAR